MNADVDKIRNSRLFKRLPDRAFERIMGMVKVRIFQASEPVLVFNKENQFEEYLGYVVTGRVLFLQADSRPLGLSMKDEFFLGRAFTLNDEPVTQLIAGSDNTFVVFIPKKVISLLTQASEKFAEMLEEIYDCIFERAKIIANDPQAPKAIHDWIISHDQQKTLSSWVGTIEARRLQGLERREKEDQNRIRVRRWWMIAIAFASVFFAESLLRYYHSSHAFVDRLIPYFELDDLRPGARWNILLGILGYLFLLATMGHFVVRHGIRKKKWKVNYQLSQQVHILFGVLGAFFIVLHTSFSMTGANIAYYAYYTVLIGLFTGFIGQFISNQIPTTIRGEQLKLDALKQEQVRLQRKAEMLMTSDHMYKTSVMLIARGVSKSFWGNIFSAPLMWLRAMRVKSTLKEMGLGEQSAATAAELLHKEFQMQQKIKFLEISNVALKRWMIIHKPIGYAVYILGMIHIVLVLLSF